MATGYSGRLILVKQGNAASPEVFTTIAALRDTTVTESEDSVETTSKDDGGKRTLLAGTIRNSITVTGTGVFTDSATLASLRTSMRAGTHSNYEIEVVESSTSAGETLTGAFRITNLEFSGSYDGEANYSLTLESDGTITAS
jgi:TP901-1 family phage major tail protein